jgi:hypothetical protein
LDLEQISAEIRQRSAWEGIDLGFALGREHFFTLWRAWLATAIPVMAVILLVFGYFGFWALFLLWWFKPLFEAPLLMWLGRSFFGDRPGVLAAVRSIPPSGWADLMALLTWRRFAPGRSFVMPIACLENLQGRNKSARLDVLQMNESSAPWLTIICMHFEAVIYVSILMVLVALVPSDLEWISLENLIKDDYGVVSTISACAYVLSMSVMAPFYVAGGFSLYLTRRSELEAWDIEIRFRRIAGRAGRRSINAVGVLVGALLLAPFEPVPALEQVMLDNASAKNMAEMVVARPEFGQLQTTDQWVYTGPEDTDSSESPAWFDELSALIDSVLPAIAAVFEVLLWATVTIAVVYLLVRVYRHRDWLGSLPRVRRRPTRRPSIVGEARPSSAALPDDIVAAAGRLIDNERYRDALGLLFRGALGVLATEHGIAVSGSATERECCDIVHGGRPPVEAAYFTNLTRCWQRVAYAHATPAHDELSDLLRRWHDYYGQQQS